MPERTNEEVVRAYLAAMQAHDLDGLDGVRHPGWTAEWPQSGERVRGPQNGRAIDENYPGGLPDLEPDQVVGSEDRWVTTPAYTIQRVVGSGDAWWCDGTVTYPDGATWHIVLMIELRDGLIHRETAYFAAPFEAPAWRAGYVERMD